MSFLWTRKAEPDFGQEPRKGQEEQTTRDGCGTRVGSAPDYLIEESKVKHKMQAGANTFVLSEVIFRRTESL